MPSTIDAGALWDWVNERHAIYIRKSIREGLDPLGLHVPKGADLSLADPEGLMYASKGSPFTRDWILHEFRFCNVFRELDRVTQWIDRNIRVPYADHPDLWLMLAIARYVNWPPTLAWLMNRGETMNPWHSWPNNHGEGIGRFAFHPTQLAAALDQRSKESSKVYTGAYMIRAESNPDAEWFRWSKNQYIGRIVIGRLWEDREEWTDLLSKSGVSMEEVWEKFQAHRYIGWGPFMAYQVVVDMRHTPLLSRAPDISSWAAVGPGSRRGLNRLTGRPLEYNVPQDVALEEMVRIYNDQDKYRAPWVPHIELSDIQNCLCETDKYLRVSNKEGRPRAKFYPGRGW